MVDIQNYLMDKWRHLCKKKKNTHTKHRPTPFACGLFVLFYSPQTSFILKLLKVIAQYEPLAT